MPLPARSLPRTWLAAALIVAALILPPAPPPGVAGAGSPGGGAEVGVLMTLSATAEDLEPAAPGAALPARPTGGLVVRVAVTNATGADVSGFRLDVPVPAGTRVTDSGLGRLGQSPGTVSGTAVTWGRANLTAGEAVGPFLFRVVPMVPAQGATLFRNASLRAEATWSGPATGSVASQALRLNGLWGEGGLRRTVLPSELTILTRERPDSQTVAIRLAVRAGGRDEDETTRGGAHWLEHAHFLGTGRYPSALAIDSVVDSVGGFNNASTSYEYTDFYYVAPADQFDLILDLLADQMQNSTFPREAFERERRVVFEELKLRNDTPAVRSFDEFMRLVFQVSPLRQDPGGTIESVQSISIDAMLAYRAQRYVTGNMAIAAIGNLNNDVAAAKIAAAFADLPVGPRAERPAAPEPVQTAPRRLEVGDGSRAAYVRLGWPVPGDDDPDSAALAVIQEVLGSTGQRLAEQIVERRGLATNVAPYYLDFSDAGAFLLAATTSPENADQVVSLLLAEIQRLRDGDVTEADVQASIRAIAGRHAIEDESNQDQTYRADAEVAGTLESPAEFAARLRAVTAADLQRVARKYLDPVNYTLVIVRA